jgi:hypothetical protein
MNKILANIQGKKTLDPITDNNNSKRNIGVSKSEKQMKVRIGSKTPAGDGGRRGKRL